VARAKLLRGFAGGKAEVHQTLADCRKFVKFPEKRISGNLILPKIHSSELIRLKKPNFKAKK
jgi:hypothetical protein